MGHRGGVGRDGYVYLHRCATGGAGCQAARVPTELVPGRAYYQFWDGDSWEATEPTGPTMDMGPGLTPLGSHHVLWLPDMGVYGMAHAAGGAGSTAVAFQVAARPEGPWSESVILHVSGCGEGFGCYTAALHGQGSGIDHVAVSIYDSYQRWPDGRLTGATRLVQAGVDIDPPPPGVCRSCVPRRVERPPVLPRRGLGPGGRDRRRPRRPHVRTGRDR